MPNVPAFVGKHLAPLFAKKTHVSLVEDIAPKLRLVRFEGDDLKGVRFTPGQKVEFPVSHTAFRHYTPTRFDSARGLFEVLFYLHGSGPGSAWAAQLKAGDEALVLGPDSRFGLDDGEKHVLLGDETSIGLFGALSQSCGPNASVTGAVEVEPGAERWLELVGLPHLAAAPRSPGARRGEALREWVKNSPNPDATYYLVGHAGSILLTRKWLLEHGGVSAKRIKAKAYWADGRVGM